jgi:DNA-directed RNA polymerase specialized sigma24 family protein
MVLVKTRKAPLGRKGENRDWLFASTRWTLILKASDSTAASAHALNALSELCRIYWRPVYGFLRRQGYGREDAQDLTQGFFAHLIERRGYARADREKGRFRSFLLAALTNFTADAHGREHALKRGGGMILEQWDDKLEAEITRAAKWRADEVYDRQWAATLVQQALNRLAQECAIAGKAELFGWLKPRLAITEESMIPYEEMARRSSRTAINLRKELTRLRARYRAILREEVCGTVRDSTEVDEELRYLCHALVAG